MERMTRRDVAGCPMLANDKGRLALLEHLAQYEDAEEHGLLVRLPCKVGDTVYAIEDGEILEDVIFEFNYGRRSDGVLTALFECADNGVSFYSDDFGKRVFFSIEEAEAALAKETAKGRPCR